jgi:hypothetical protein
MGSEHAQRAAHLIAEAKKAMWAALPFEESETNPRTTYMGPDGNWRTREKDKLGRERVVVHDRPQEEARAQLKTQPWDRPEDVKLPDLATWSMQQKQAFRRAHPDHWERLKYAESKALESARR